jgi:hypothetical protein
MVSSVFSPEVVSLALAPAALIERMRGPKFSTLSRMREYIAQSCPTISEKPPSRPAGKNRKSFFCPRKRRKRQPPRRQFTLKSVNVSEAHAVCPLGEKNEVRGYEKGGE